MIAERHYHGEDPAYLPGKIMAWLRRHGLKNRLHSTIAQHIPIGYEDETGFHLGMEEPSVCFDPEAEADLPSGNR